MMNPVQFFRKRRKAKKAAQAFMYKPEDFEPGSVMIVDKDATHEAIKRRGDRDSRSFMRDLRKATGQ